MKTNFYRTINQLMTMRMKTLLTALVLMMICLAAKAQNKSLGVGTATPNPNAALHVDGPTNNQGFLMPRLSAAQRGTLTATLIADAVNNNNGLMVYDTDLKTIYVWDGTKWNTTGQVAGGARLQFPYVDSVSTALNGPMLYLTYSNPNAAGMIYLRRYDTTMVTNPFVIEHFGRGAIMNVVQHYKGTGISSLLDNPANPNNAIRGTTVGSGAGIQGVNTGTGNGFAGTFTNTQLTNSYPAIQANSKGSGSAIRAFQGATDGTGPGIDVFMLNTSSTADGITINQQALGRGGSFNINNASNASNALEATTNGTGGAAKFTVTNSASTMPALWVQTNSNQPLSAAVYGLNTGTGDAAGAFRISNSGNNFAALYGETNGSGGGSSAVRGLNLGAGNGAYFRKNGATANSAAMWADNFGNDGYGAIIQNISTTNAKPALFAEAVGSGSSIWALKTTGDVSGDALLAENQIATGSAAKFQNTLASNSSAAVRVNSNSTAGGYAINATQSGTGDAIFATANNGSGGNFQNSNASNNASVLFAMTNAPSGYGVGAMNTAEGNALSIFQGGMKVSTATLSAGTTITTRAVAYLITGGGPYTFSFTPTDGDIFYFFNSTGGSVGVGVYSLSPSAGRTFIFLGGSLRGL